MGIYIIDANKLDDVMEHLNGKDNESSTDYNEFAKVLLTLFDNDIIEYED